MLFIKQAPVPEAKFTMGLNAVFSADRSKSLRWADRKTVVC